MQDIINTFIFIIKEDFSRPRRNADLYTSTDTLYHFILYFCIISEWLTLEQRGRKGREKIRQNLEIDCAINKAPCSQSFPHLLVSVLVLHRPYRKYPLRKRQLFFTIHAGLVGYQPLHELLTLDMMSSDRPEAKQTSHGS